MIEVTEKASSLTISGCVVRTLFLRYNIAGFGQNDEWMVCELLGIVLPFVFGC